MMAQKRQFHARISKDFRPDGLATIWVMADRDFTQKEASAKTSELLIELLPKCREVVTGYNDAVCGGQVVGEKTAEIVCGPRQIEVIVPPKCVNHALAYMKKNWKGQWSKEKTKE